MSDFLFFEAIEEDGSLVGESEEEIKMVSNNDFIDDTEIDDSVEDHYAFTNVNRNYADAFYEYFSDFDFDQKPNNYCKDSKIANSYGGCCHNQNCKAYLKFIYFCTCL